MEKVYFDDAFYEKLANEIEDFVYDYDPYAYNDNVESRDIGFKETLDTLKNRPENLALWFEICKNDSDRDGLSDEQKDKIDKLLNSLKTIINNNKINEKNAKENVIMANENKAVGWVIMPKMNVNSKHVREVTDDNGKVHKKVTVFLPEKDGKKLAFSILDGQAIPSKNLPFDELVQIPVNDYGIDLFEVRNKEDIQESGNEKPLHMKGEEACKFLKDTYKNLNNDGVKYLKLPKECVFDSDKIEKAKDMEFKNKFVSVHLPKYLKPENGFNYAGASFYASKAYHVTGEDLRAIQILPDAKFELTSYDKETKKESKIEVNGIDLYNKNNKDYLASLNVSKSDDVKAKNAQNLDKPEVQKEQKAPEKAKTNDDVSR